MAYTSSQVVQAVPTGINSALVYIGGGSLSGTSTTFPSMFSATYNNYLVKINSLAGSTGTPVLLLTLGSATTAYVYSQSFANATATWAFSAGSASASSIELNQLGTVISSTSMEIMSPFLAEKTTVLSKGLNYTGSQWNETVGGHTGSTQFTAFTLASSTAATLSGTVTVYGYTLS